MRKELAPIFSAYEWYTEQQGVLSFEALFGNAGPVEVELGCGKGKFMIDRALEAPGINFLGVDRVGKWMKMAQIRSEERHLDNLKYLKTDVRDLLDRLPEQSVSVFHIYFPDPWPKKRHHKRRLVTGALLKVLHTNLCKEGSVEIATDDTHYYQWIKRTIQETQLGWQHIRESVNRRLVFETMMTSYEKRYSQQGKPLYYLELVK